MIGILGGTFDPVHNGHLHVAREARSRLALEQVQFMPCAQPVHRGRPCASARQRVAMLELALAESDGFVVNRLEVERGGPSFMVDSLREICRGGDRPLVLLLGADAFNGFAGWKQPGQILELANLAVCVRPGVEVDPDLYAARRVDSPGRMAKQTSGAVLMLEIDPVDCSSSALREMLGRGERPPAGWLNPAVADYILENQLYQGNP